MKATPYVDFTYSDILDLNLHRSKFTSPVRRIPLRSTRKLGATRVAISINSNKLYWMR